MRFTLRQLSYFVAAGQTGSVTRAAEAVNISQPSISAAIAHLETELGAQLFVRYHAQGLSLTPAGQRLLSAARELLRDSYGLYEVVNSAMGIVAGPITVGAFRTFAPLVLPEIWSGFQARYPDVRMNVMEGSEAELLEGLRTARLDIALTYELSLSPDMTFVPLAHVPTYVLLAADHPMAGRKSLRLAELAEQSFVLLDMPLTRQYFLSLFEKMGLAPRILTETSSPAALRSYVAAGLGYSLMTMRPANMRAENNLPLAYVELEQDLPPMKLGLAWLTALKRPRVCEAFEEFCCELAQQGALPGMAPLPGADEMDHIFHG
ncbi:LysR family transcriptional regulator [Pseudogemmobacter faecipullorum]|uniref:LysR family transcriptional regulator n=1 Tax=Pseudogemmobacter faecipullorum TaxID=2755041 RepID=A0ABS8CNF9_9RHOB|nr:LysR family transcriptional regulator [Pseudogemmobacter faecipullorum]MCB5410941.1 LysR family transcriptional regulator [Pseudogemmobacter faecipullorum]